MSPWLILACVAAYFTLLLGIAWVTGRRADEAGYFLGNKRSPWYVVAFGLIGDSLSGVTYLSVPGQVGTAKCGYLQVVFGYVLGYVVIAQVLLPLYYRLNLTSIYSYLGDRFGRSAELTGAGFFLLSRTLGAAARLFLAANVFQAFVFDRLGIPFWFTVTAIIALILIYTWRGGIKTLVWTDSFQSFFLVLGVILSIGLIARELGLGPSGMVRQIVESPLSQVFFWDWRAPDNFWKQFLSGAAIAVVMTGLDQNNMQKTLSCRSLRESQKNLYSFAVILVAVNAFFLALGVLLHQFVAAKGFAAPAQPDQLFPTVALQYLGPVAAMVFVLGLTAATFNSADSVLTTLTTSFCIDFLGFERRTDLTPKLQTRWRHAAHLGFALILLAAILVFKAANRGAVIQLVLKMAGYTYGPLLGLFALGLLTKVRVGGPWVPVVCVAAPVVCWVLAANSAAWLDGYVFGFELLILNGLLVAAGLVVLARWQGDTVR
ncbi:MAG TPA: sodium:solute symporter [Verrucomicrobiota bacterium]|nr:sodium:solute symporter [Verrucomicrobiales bacterium]HRI11624.1 sodium:solute symporter [Verrucomicrobiota bacterium]